MTKNLCHRYSFIFFLSSQSSSYIYFLAPFYVSLYPPPTANCPTFKGLASPSYSFFFFFEWWLHLHIIKKPFSWNYYLVPVYVHQTFKFLLDLFWELIISFVDGRKKKKSTGRWIKIEYLVQRVYGTNARRWIICCSHAVQSNSRSSPLTCPKKAPLNLIISLYHLLQRMLPKALSDFPSPMKLHSLNLLH